MSVLTWLAETAYAFMQAAPSMPALIVALVILEPLLVLVHEFGHALAARRLLNTDVVVAIGSKGTLLDTTVGSVHLYVNAFGGITGARGLAGFDDSRASRRDIVLIALAGPAASLAGTLTCGWLLSLAPAHGVVHVLLWACAAGGMVGAFNALPFRFQQRRGDPVWRSDGRIALDALTGRPPAPGPR